MKAENLKILKEHKINVPDFDVIKWEDKDKKIDTNKYNGKYAIRSSSNLEDGDKNSFAGQFDTYLNVGKKDIESKVNSCFNSINNSNVEIYLRENNISKDNLKIDVIIQKMVNSEISGVLFTSNPNGLLNEVVITVGKGLGSGVVEDKVDTTTYYYNTTDNVYYYEGKVDLLNKDTIDKLIEIQSKIKDIFGNYLDIEFAIENNEIYILQTRPITTINDRNLLILDNSNIVESYPGVSLPLTISFVKFVYTGVFKGVAYRVLKNRKILEKYDSNLNNMVGSSNGRIYYKISNWYTIIKFLPMSKKIIPVWQEMLGVKNKSYDKEKVEIPLISKIKTYFNCIYEITHVTKNMDMLNNRFIEINKYFYDHYREDMSIIEVIKLYNKIKEDVLALWDITLVNDMYSFIYTGLLKHRFKKKNLSEDLVNEYISGISNIESLKPIKSLITIAYNKDNLSKEEFNKELDKYIELYGDRNLEELKLESETFRTNRKLLIDKINEYCLDKDKLKELYENINKEKSPLNIKEDFITKFIVKRAMTGIKNREISRLNRSRIYGMVRSMFLTIAKRLYEDNRINNINDIYYLEIEEIFYYEKYDLKKLIETRKNNYLIFNELPNYSRLIFTGNEFDKYHKSVNSVKKNISKDKLIGIPCSSGIVEGYALVVEDIKNIKNVKDKILITKMTDPGWVFLLATCKGVISEKGSLLSHTAIISREIKVPSIVGVDEVTNIIKTNDYIRMNANTGEIEILERGK